MDNMYGSQQKIRHVNGAGEVRYFTPAVASNKSAMKNGGWFPQEEAHPQALGTQSSNGTPTNVVIDYKSLVDEKDGIITDLNIQLAAEKERTEALQNELDALKSEISAAKSVKKTKEKDNQ